MLVEVSSGTIIQFLEMFMDLGGHRGADLKYSCGFVKRGHKDRGDVQFCVMGMDLKHVTVFIRGCELETGVGSASVQVTMQVPVYLRGEFLSGKCLLTGRNTP